ncbi:recombinase family protein [Caldifermentibacillus hisashii]|uniref:recombinase family protein n=1 Tax=Caldifermentibacillus hisashii TaxID=996558 RepID=UPI0034419E67
MTYKVSRLSCSLSDSLKLVEEIHKEKVRFISIKEGEYGTPHVNLQFNILASVAQYQREKISENVQFGMSQRARAGKWNGVKY